MTTILAVAIKELLQLRRDRRMLPLVLAVPILQLVIFGYAANMEVRHIRLLVVDQDRTPASRRLVDRFLESRWFDLAGTAETTDEVEPWFVRGRAAMALVIGRGYGRGTDGRGAAPVQILSDGANATTGSIGLGYAAGILRGAAGGLVELKPRVWYNPDLRSRWFYLPAVLAMVLMLTTLTLSSMSVVKEREIGTIEQIIVTPLRGWQFLVGKLAPFVALGLFNVTLITLVMVGWFRVPLRGSFVLLSAASLLFIIVMIGLGLLMSTIARNQQQAMIGSIFMVMVPMIYLSGLLFPIENMPRLFQAITWVIPLRYYVIVLRGVILKGNGWTVLWPQLATLAGMGFGIVWLAAGRFRKRLD